MLRFLPRQPSQPRCKLLLTPSLLPCARREVVCAYIEEDADYATARRSLLEPLLPGGAWQEVLREPTLMEPAATVRPTWLAAYARAADTNAEGRAATASLELRTRSQLRARMFDSESCYPVRNPVMLVPRVKYRTNKLVLHLALTV